MTELPLSPPAPPGPMPFRLLLDEALRQARRNFRAVYPAVAIPVAIVSSGVAVFQAIWFSDLTARLATQPFAFFSPGYLAILLVQITLLVIAGTALQVGAVDAVGGRPVDMGRAWRFAFRGNVLGTQALAGLLGLVSVFACCLPALVVIPLLVFVTTVMVEEGRFGAAALSRSGALVWHSPPGRWQEKPLFKVMLLLLVSGLLAYLLALLISLPFQIPMYIDTFRHAAAGEDALRRMSSWIWLQVPAQLLNALANQAVAVYTSFGVVLLFHDARGRKEGTDLRQEIDSMFSPPPPPPYSGEPAP